MPTLPLIRSLPFVSGSLGPARPHASPTELSLSAWPLTLSLSPSRSRRATPHPWGTLSLFFLYFLCPPLVQMARTISHRVDSCRAPRYPARAMSVPFDRDNGEPFKNCSRRKKTEWCETEK